MCKKLTKEKTWLKISIVSAIPLKSSFSFIIERCSWKKIKDGKGKNIKSLCN